MAFKDEIKAVVAAEKAQVHAKLDELAAKIADLEGKVVSPDDVAELKADIEGIFDPEPPVEA